MLDWQIGYILVYSAIVQFLVNNFPRTICEFYYNFMQKNISLDGLLRSPQKNFLLFFFACVILTFCFDNNSLLPVASAVVHTSKQNFHRTTIRCWWTQEFSKHVNLTDEVDLADDTGFITYTHFQGIYLLFKLFLIICQNLHSRGFRTFFWC